MEITIITILILVFCLITLCLFLVLKKERKEELTKIPQPANLFLKDSWGSIEKFVSLNNNEDEKTIEPSLNEVEYSSIESEVKNVHEIPKKVDDFRFMDYEKAFNNFILKDENEISLPLDTVKNSLGVVDTSGINASDYENEFSKFKLNDSTIEIPKEQRDKHLEREIVISRINQMVREKVMNSLSNLKSHISENSIENFSDNEFKSEETMISELINVVNKIGTKISNVAKPIIESLADSILENFNNYTPSKKDSGDIAENLNKVIDKVVSEETSLFSKTKKDSLKEILNVLFKNLTN